MLDFNDVPLGEGMWDIEIRAGKGNLLLDS